MTNRVAATDVDAIQRRAPANLSGIENLAHRRLPSSGRPIRLGGAVVFLQCCDGGFELGRDLGALATGQAAAQFGAEFVDVVLKRDHRPLLRFEDGTGAPRRSGRVKDACATKRARGSRFCRAFDNKVRALARSLRAAKLGALRSLGRPDRRGTMGGLRRENGIGGLCAVRAKIPPGLLRAGRCRRCRSVAVRPASARPDQAEGLAAFVIEEVGVDRRGEARIVELDREVIAALAGAPRPRGADLRFAREDPVAGRVVAGPAGLWNDADAFGLDAEGDDLALELVAGLLEGVSSRSRMFIRPQNFFSSW